MLKFKKEFENHAIALADGTLINKHTIGSEHVQNRLSGSPWFAYMLEPDLTKNDLTQNVKSVSETPKKRVRK